MTIRWGPRHPGLCLAVLSAAYLALGAYWTGRAPAGRWRNRVFDFAMWEESDPGEGYIPAAHELVSRPGRSSFPGHPGVPLNMVLFVEQAGLYSIGRLAGTSADFTSFTARHALEVWAVAKWSMVLLHLLSFVALYHFALALFRRTDVALWSVGIYATSFPVLYYLNRVSVEPLMNAFFLGTAVCLVKAEEAPPASRRPLAWAAFGGACAASAFFTKLHLMALWPVFGAAYITALMGSTTPVPLPRRLTMLLAYLGGLLASGAAYAYFTDWGAFFRFWGGFTKTTPTPGASVSGLLLQMGVGIASSLTDLVSKTKVTDLLPACTMSNCFFFFEFLFLLAVPFGVAPSFRQSGSRRRLLSTVLAYGLLVGAIWFYRAGGRDFHGFHYLFPVLAAVAPVAALGIAVAAPGLLDVTRSRTRRGLEMGLALVALHYGGFFAVIDSKRQDGEAFLRAGGPYYFAALRRAEPSDRIAVIGKRLDRFHGLTDDYAEEDRRSSLVRALEDKVIVSDEAPVELFVRRARRQGVGMIVDFTLANPGPWTLEEWASLGAHGPRGSLATPR